MNQMDYLQFHLVVMELIMFMVKQLLMMSWTVILFVVDLVKMMELFPFILNKDVLIKDRMSFLTVEFALCWSP